MSSPSKRSLKRPAIQISSSKRTKIGIKLKCKSQQQYTIATPSISSDKIKDRTKDDDNENTFTNRSSSTFRLPSILTKQYHSSNNDDKNERSKGECDNISNDRLDKDSQNDYDDVVGFSELLNKFIEETDNIHEIILAIQCLTDRQCAAICPFTTNTCNGGYIPFVLKPMIQHALNTTVSSSLQDHDKINQISSACVSTGFNIELETLDVENKIRLIQLHGIEDGDDDNIAVLLFNHYVDAVHDAASCGQGTYKSKSDGMIMNETQMIVQLFLECVQHHGCNGRFVSVDKLKNALKSAWNQQRQQQLSTRMANDSKFKSRLPYNPDKWMETLVQIQLLLPRVTNNSITSCTTSFWYTLPKMGVAANTIVEGRKMMMNRIQRSYNKEVRRSTLDMINMSLYKSGNNKKGSCCMTGAFHVRDLLARDAVKLVHRPSGDFIRLKELMTQGNNS